MNFKELIEKKNTLVDKVNEMFGKCETETRAFNEAEIAEFNKLTAEIKAIDETLKMSEVARSFEKSAQKQADKKETSAQDVYAKEYRAFGDYLRGNELQNRDATDVNFTKGDNGAIIPSSIANKIIETVENICPIYAKSTKYHVKGSLSFPVYDESTQKVQCAYQTEFTAMLSTSGKFTNVTLNGYLAGAMTKISRSLMNNAQFDVVAYAITKIAQAIARFLENELLNGTVSAGKMQGVMPNATQIVTADNATKITADDLISVQAKVPELYQANCEWYMSQEVMVVVRKLKDLEGRYVLQPDLTRGFGYMLLGKHVNVSDNLPKTLVSATKVIAYGDASGLYTNIHEDVEMQILREKFADEHVDAVVAWLEADSKVVEQQKFAVLQLA